MARKYLQTGLAGSAGVSHTILHAQLSLPIRTQCRAERVSEDKFNIPNIP